MPGGGVLPGVRGAGPGARFRCPGGGPGGGPTGRPGGGPTGLPGGGPGGTTITAGGPFFLPFHFQRKKTPPRANPTSRASSTPIRSAAKNTSGPPTARPTRAMASTRTTAATTHRKGFGGLSEGLRSATWTDFSFCETQQTEAASTEALPAKNKSAPIPSPIRLLRIPR
ncbi:MAG: hypothetical protein D6750_10430 [Bacteroidetes bacterium]|nr:MAG: hypothetical protein D6750_10430 [Bacteroidota bacterium]